jgi:hypothetical protein
MAADARMILSHAHIPATMQKCAHAGAAARDDALTSPDRLLGGSQRHEEPDRAGKA